MGSEFVLRIIFYGLVAFAPTKDGNMTAVFPDARGVQYSSDGCKIPSHIPSLYVASDECRKGLLHCDFSPVLDLQFGFPLRNFGVQGSWTIGDNEVSFLIRDKSNPSALAVPLTGGIKTAAGTRLLGSNLPEKSEQAVDFSWIPNPSYGSQIDGADLKGQPIRAISARAKVTGGNASVCHFIETKEDLEKDRKVCTYAFKPLIQIGPAETIQPQAIADAVMATVKLPRNSEVIVRLKSWVSKEAPVDIILSPGQRDTVDVWLTNMPIRTSSHEALCADHDIDRHFELYYNLSKPPEGKLFPLSGRPIPQRLDQECVPSQSVQPKGDDQCPILIFEKPGGGRYPGDKLACGTKSFVVLETKP